MMGVDSPELVAGEESPEVELNMAVGAIREENIGVFHFQKSSSRIIAKTPLYAR